LACVPFIAPHLGVSIFAHDRLALRLCVLEHRQNLVELFLRQFEHLLQVLRPLGRVVLPAVGTGLRTLLSASCDRGCGGGAGCEDSSAARRTGQAAMAKPAAMTAILNVGFMRYFLWISDRLRFRRWTLLPARRHPSPAGLQFITFISFISFVRPHETEELRNLLPRNPPLRAA